VALHDAIHKKNVSDEDVLVAVNSVLAQGMVIIDLASKEVERWEE
jgi:two-component system sensor histidine kinase EvgS